MRYDASHLFLRPRFDPIPPDEPPVHSDTASYDGNISSLYGLIHFNSEKNGEKTFCKQAVVNPNFSPDDGNGVDQTHARFCIQTITYRELHGLVVACADWAIGSLGRSKGQRPVALYMESDVGLFLHLAALLELQIPVLVVSARLGSPSLSHLIRETKASTILVTKRTKAMLEDTTVAAADVIQVPHWQTFLDKATHIDISRAKPNIEVCDDKSRKGEMGTTVGALILHSSGTTGLPKPIYLAQRYLLGYAACHELHDDETGRSNLSTLPLYHGFGLLAPCLSLSIGLTCCLPPASIIPAGRSTTDLLDLFSANTLMTVPSIVDDMLSLPSSKEKNAAIAALQKLDFLAVGGGALAPVTGEDLIENNIKLVNHYGVTEIGAIAPVFRPQSDYNWRYLRLREDLGLRLQPISDADANENGENSSKFKLIGYPVGWDAPFEVQDELERNPDNTTRNEVRIMRRTDDVIVLKSGEKVMPRLVETSLATDPAVKTAVCIGDGFFEVLVLVEMSSSAQQFGDGPEEQQREVFRNHVWGLIEPLNASLDGHARISSIEAVIVKPPGKSIPRSDKGSVMRREVLERFREEIEAAHSQLEMVSQSGLNSSGIVIDTTDVKNSMKGMVAAVAGRIFAEPADDGDDFFERGMDSLQAVRLARLLNGALKRVLELNEEQQKGPIISTEFIYANPSVNRLTRAVERLLHHTEGDADQKDGPRAENYRLSRVQRTLDLSIQQVRYSNKRPSSTRVALTFLVTGVTGNLGAHVLSQLVRNPQVKKIICLLRDRQVQTSGNREPKETRLRAALDAADLTLTARQWSKIQLEVSSPDQWTTRREGAVSQAFESQPGSVTDGNHGTKSLSEPDSGLDKIFHRLAKEVTHVLHLAWPMDFHRTLDSFGPQIRTLQGLLDLSRAAAALRPGVRVRLVFASSIATVRNFPNVCLPSKSISVPEAELDDPRVSTAMGYAEAKWVCERTLARVGPESGIEPVVVRIGQLSGPERSGGVWKSSEHIPALVRASQVVGAVPDLRGSASWLPVDRAARSLMEMVLQPGNVPGFLHLENPTRQPIGDICTFIAAELGLQSGPMPFEDWMKRAIEAGEIESLQGFFRDDFRDLASGAVVLGTEEARRVSATLRGSGGVPRELVAEYIRRWRKEGLLK